jgi:hypothetical protein
VETLVDCLLYWQKIALNLLARALPIVILRVLKVQMIAHACLTQGHLVCHAEGVDHLVVLIAVEHACLLHLGHHLLLRGWCLAEVVGRHLLRCLLVVHMLGEVAVVHPGLALACAVPDLPISCCLIHIVTHLYSFYNNCLIC